MTAEETPEEPTYDAVGRRGRGRQRGRYVLAAVLLALPLSAALLGPWLAGPPEARGIAYGPADGEHPFGTDFVGRDVWRQLLLGGRSVVLVGGGAAVAAYLLGVPLGMWAAATRRRWVDEALMRPLDLMMAVPSLLTLILVAGLAAPGPLLLGGIVAAIMLPEVVRVTRTAALEAAHSPAMEAMRLHAESWWRRNPGYLGRSILPILSADFGTRAVGALYLVATAAFLGVGVAPDAADWAVMIDRNQPGFLLQPWAVLAPALLITSLAVGLNLLFDEALVRNRRPTGEKP